MQTLAVLLLALSPLAAQPWEAGVFYGQQRHKTLTIQGESAEARHANPFALRLGYRVASWNTLHLQLAVSYLPKVEAVLAERGSEIPGLSYGTEAASVGMMLQSHSRMSLGMGLDVRFEKARMSSPGFVQEVRFSRPWVRAHAGYALSTRGARPFLGVEFSVPLTSSQADERSSGEDAIKALAPRLQFGLYGGVRF